MILDGPRLRRQMTTALKTTTVISAARNDFQGNV
jgi:hypothetical protein